MAVPLGILAGLGLFSLALLLWGRSNALRQGGRLLMSPSLLEFCQTLQKLTWQNWFESQLRAGSGQPLERPFGSNRHFYGWEKLEFNPIYLTGRPRQISEAVETSTILGSQAEKPLQLAIPILIGGMSYGNALSLRSKIALAKAATQAGTATNSGNGPFLPEERRNAGHYILQISRGFWSRDPAILRQADLIEIGLGHGAWDSAPVRIKGYKVETEMAKRVGSLPGLDLLIDARLPEARDTTGLKQYVQALRANSGGVPIGVKLGATHYIERELAEVLAAGVDLFIFDGAEGGTHGGPAILVDDVGLPTLPALCRAVRYLEETGQRRRISLVVGGGLYAPGDVLKCLALGADAVIIGTIACLAVAHTQLVKTSPWEPPTELIFHRGRSEKQLDPEAGAESVSKFLRSWVAEMEEAVRTMGKKSLRELSRADLVALDRRIAAMANVEYSRREEEQSRPG